MAKKTIKASDVLGDNYYIYELTSSNYTPALNGTITITCTMKDVYGAVASNKSITLYQNGTSKGAKTTNSSGVATWSITCSSAGLQKFNIKDASIEVFVDNKSNTDHTHSNYVTTSDSRLSDARTPTSHAHGSITNDGKITSSTTMAGNSQYVVYADTYGAIKRADTMPANYLRDPSAYSQIGNSAGDSQYTINGKINTALAGKADLNHTHNQYLTSHQSLDSKTVTVEKLATAESGYLSSYAVKQNGVQVGNTINIPKDFLVKSGSVKTVTTANNPVSGYSVGDKYIDLVINTKDTSGTNEHIYILVSDLVTSSIAISDVTNLQTTLNNKVDTAGTGLSKSGTTLNHSNSLTALGSVSFKKIKYDANGHITGTSDVTASDLPTHTHNQYLTSHQDISGKIDTAGTGLSKSGTTLNHSNSITALTTTSFKKIKYDAQGHITETADVTASDLPSHTHSAYVNPTIADNLTTDNSAQVLSAKQGKVLNDTKANKSQVVDWDEIVFVDKTDDATGSIILNFLA